MIFHGYIPERRHCFRVLLWHFQQFGWEDTAHELHEYLVNKKQDFLLPMQLAAIKYYYMAIFLAMFDQQSSVRFFNLQYLSVHYRQVFF